MCEIYAISSGQPVRANDSLRLFYQDSVAHPQGWGLAWRDQDGRVRLHKEGIRAIDSIYLSGLLETPISSTHLIAHIRNATMGSLSYENSHPFVLEDHHCNSWVIAHNGTLIDDSLTNAYRSRCLGSIDSECAAYYLIGRIDKALDQKGEDLTFDERFDILSQAMWDLSPSNKLNLAIDDGTCIYLHTNTVEPTLYVRRSGSAAYFCTRPIEDGDGWEVLPQNRLVAYRGGRRKRMGAAHDYTIDEAEYFRSLSAL